MFSSKDPDGWKMMFDPSSDGNLVINTEEDTVLFVPKKAIDLMTGPLYDVSISYNNGKYTIVMYEDENNITIQGVSRYEPK